jgi:hypothetical protein
MGVVHMKWIRRISIHSAENPRDAAPIQNMIFFTGSFLFLFFHSKRNTHAIRWCGLCGMTGFRFPGPARLSDVFVFRFFNRIGR